MREIVLIECSIAAVPVAGILVFVFHAPFLLIPAVGIGVLLAYLVAALRELARTR